MAGGAGTLLLQRKVERDGVVKPGEGFRETLLWAFYIKRGLRRKTKKDVLLGPAVVGQRVSKRG